MHLVQGDRDRSEPRQPPRSVGRARGPRRPDRAGPGRSPHGGARRRPAGRAARGDARNFSAGLVFVRTRLLTLTPSCWPIKNWHARLTLTPLKTGHVVMPVKCALLQFRTHKTSVVIGFSSVRTKWRQQYYNADAIENGHTASHHEPSKGGSAP